MDSDDNKKFEYVRKTALTDDFRRLKPETGPSIASTPSTPKDDVSCTICLEAFDEPRTLPCQHRFCRVCLQYVIDNCPRDSDSDRGFECILCGHFVKVLNYSVPRSAWADNIPDSKLLFTRHSKRVKEPEDGKQAEQAKTQNDGIHETDHCRWILDWRVSTYPKSYFIENDLDPRKRTKNGFLIKAAADNDLKNYYEDTYDENVINSDVDPRRRIKHGGLIKDLKTNKTETNDGCVTRADDGSKTNKSEGAGGLTTRTVDIIDDETRTAAEINNENVRGTGCSRITSAVFYNDNVVVYDEGLCEVQIYKPDLTLKSSFTQTNIFAIAVLESDLFMTNPETRTVEIVNLDTFEKKEPIALTLQCFGISSLGDQLAVLLCDNSDKEFHISFLNARGIIGGSIFLRTTRGNIEFVSPRQLAVCPLTRLAYVSDEQLGAVKCFRLDGDLSWERRVFDAGVLSVYNGYAIVARKFTSSLDVLSGRGAFAGRLESAVYGIEAPGVIAIREDEPEIVVVDRHNMIHAFCIRKATELTEVIVNSRNCLDCVLI